MLIFKTDSASIIIKPAGAAPRPGLGARTTIVPLSTMFVSSCGIPGIKVSAVSPTYCAESEEATTL